MSDVPAGDDFVYVVIRVPKSGSTSLANMMRDTLASAQVFDMPTDAAAHVAYPLVQRLRLARRRLRHLRRLFGTTSMDQAWRTVAARARPGDVVTGHIRFGDAVLPGFVERNISLVREPVARALSQYNYSREGFAKRGGLQRFLHRGPLQAASRYDFSGYLSYLDEHRAAYGDVAVRYVCGDTPMGDPLAFIRRHYFHIGTLENLDTCLGSLGRKLGVTVAARRDNVTTRQDATGLRATDRPVFERVFGGDIALYEAVRKLEAEGG